MKIGKVGKRRIAAITVVLVLYAWTWIEGYRRLRARGVQDFIVFPVLPGIVFVDIEAGSHEGYLFVTYGFDFESHSVNMTPLCQIYGRRIE